MHKTLLIFLVSLCCISKAWGQDAAAETFGFKLIDSVSAPQVSKAVLYTRARAWMANNFNSAQDVIQMDDKEAGKIIGKGSFIYPYKNMLGVTRTSVTFTITIDVKDGKFRVQMNDFYHHGGKGAATIIDGGSLDDAKTHGNGWTGMIPQAQWDKIRAYSEDQAISIIKSLQASLAKPAEKDDF